MGIWGTFKPKSDNSSKRTRFVKCQNSNLNEIKNSPFRVIFVFDIGNPNLSKFKPTMAKSEYKLKANDYSVRYIWINISEVPILM